MLTGTTASTSNNGECANLISKDLWLQTATTERTKQSVKPTGGAGVESQSQTKGTKPYEQAEMGWQGKEPKKYSQEDNGI